MGLILRLLVAAGLVVDAVIHFHLAPSTGHTGTINESMLFWVQGAVALVVAILVLVRPRPIPYLIAFLVSASAFGAVVLYRYVDVGAIGPVGDMYEPVWYTEKVLTTVAEGVATVASAIAFFHAYGRRRLAESREQERPVNA